MNAQLFLIAALMAVVSCQVPKPCDSPSQWEGRIFQYDYKMGYTMQGKYSYDDQYQRERTIEETIIGSDDESYDILYLHNQQVQYTYNFKTKSCKKETITRPWRKFSIPANATFLGESYAGSSGIKGAGLLLSIWEEDFTDDQGNKIHYQGAWTWEKCLPVSANYFSDKFGAFHAHFFDITPGIENPNIWVPRPECLKL